MTRVGFHLILLVAISRDWSLSSSDCSSAFVPGGAAPERPEMISGRLPKDSIFAEAVDMNRYGDLWAIVGSVDGLVNSPRLWHAEVTKRMKEKGWVAHSLDPALYLFWGGKTLIGIAGIHVDDMLSCFSRCEKGRAARAILKDAFHWEEWQDDASVYCGKMSTAERKNARRSLSTWRTSSKAPRSACPPPGGDSRRS